MLAKLSLALYAFMMLGVGTEIRHCRKAVNGCEARMRVFATWMCDAGQQYRVSPFTLAAIAYVETGLDPFKVGKVGERGIMQVHPRSPWVRAVGGLPGSCRAHGACQKKVIQAGAVALSSGARVCNSELEALGYYNTGKCSITRYARRVLSIKKRMENVGR